MQSVVKRNNVRMMGQGVQPIIFAHGFGCDQQSWQFIIDAFLKDYKVILFDYVGAGHSDSAAYDAEKYGSLQGYAQDIIEICEELKINQAIFIGHSVSCMIGVIVANKIPSLISKLIMIGPSPCYLNDADYTGGFERADLESLFEFMDSNYLGWSSSLAPAIMGNADRPELGAFLTNSFCSTDPEIARQFARVTFFSDNRKDLEKVAVDSLTIQCQSDMIAPLVVGEYVHKHVKGNNFHLMNATGHCPHISAPGETIQAIKDYLKS